MYAVIRTGGKQYRVSPGDLLVVEKIDGEAGAEVAFDQVLMVGGEGEPAVGAPLVEGAVVRATLIETRKGDKVKVFKKIRRQGYRRTKGHRQIESVLRVTGLEGAGYAATWDGVVDLTPLSALRLRARGLAARDQAETEALEDEASVAEATAAPEAVIDAPAEAAAPKPARKRAKPKAADETSEG